MDIYFGWMDGQLFFDFSSYGIYSRKFSCRVFQRPRKCKQQSFSRVAVPHSRFRGKAIIDRYLNKTACSYPFPSVLIVNAYNHEVFQLFPDQRSVPVLCLSVSVPRRSLSYYLNTITSVISRYSVS